MTRKRRILWGILALCITASLPAASQSGGGYDLSWNTIDGGGGVSGGGAYTLGGAIGQPDAGVLSGGDYTLAGGFWLGGESAEPPAHYIFLPLALR